MNRTDYMNELKEALSSYDEAIADEIISDYEEHFRMGALNGKSEEQICAELGSIDELVAEIDKLSQGSSSSRSRNEDTEASAEETGDFADSFAHNMGSFGATLYKNITEFANNLTASIASGEFGSNVAAGAGKFADKATEFATGFASKASEFAGEVAKGFEANMNRDRADDAASSRGANPGQSSEETAAQQDDEAETEEADMESTVDAGENAAVSGESAAAAGENTAVSGESATVSGENAAVSGENAATAGENTSGTQTSGLFGNKPNCEECVEKSGEDFDSIEIEAGNADVYLVRSQSNTIKFNYTNNGTKNQQMAYRFYQEQKGSTIYAGVRNVGSTGFFKRVCPPEIKLVIEVPNGLKFAHIRTVSGDIKSSKLNIQTLKCDCTSGDLSIDDNDLTDLLIQSASGDVKVFESGIGACRIHTASGDVDINNTDAEGVMADVASGDINVSGTIKKISAKSASGDINLSCVKASEVTASAIAGDISVKLKFCDNGYTAGIHTVSGESMLSFKDESIVASKSGQYTFGNGEARLNLSTVSGDVSVQA